MWRQSLSLVDNQNRTQPARVSRFKSPAQLQQKVRLRLPLLNVQQRGYMLVEFRDGQARIEDIGNQHRAVQTLHHPAQNGGLAGSYFPGHDDQPLAAFNAIVEIGHYFRMRRSEIDKARIGSQREG